jgi:hypothetical protein
MEDSRPPEKILELWRNRLRDKMWIIMQFNIETEIIRKITKRLNRINLDISLLESYVEYMANLNLKQY